MNQLLKKLEVFPVSCAVVEETAIEVTPLGITKGAGLESLSSYLNIPIENTIMIVARFLISSVAFPIATAFPALWNASISFPLSPIMME